jgi:hypothetical protein
VPEHLTAMLSSTSGLGRALPWQLEGVTALCTMEAALLTGAAPGPGAGVAKPRAGKVCRLPIFAGHCRQATRLLWVHMHKWMH